jgi:hypothetical protein
MFQKESGNLPLSKVGPRTVRYILLATDEWVAEVISQLQFPNIETSRFSRVRPPFSRLLRIQTVSKSYYGPWIIVITHLKKTPLFSPILSLTLTENDKYISAIVPPAQSLDLSPLSHFLSSYNERTTDSPVKSLSSGASLTCSGAM